MSSTLIAELLARLPILVWLGAGFLGWIAGEMLAADEAAMAYIPVDVPETAIAATFAALVLFSGWVLNRIHARTPGPSSPGE